MADLKVMFLHGMEGTPEGTKPTFLKRNGYRVLAPVLPKDNFELSLARAKDTFENFWPDIVVGSSRGGAIACALDTGDVPKILIAPAYKKFRVKDPIIDKTTTILHCINDEIVEFEQSRELEENYGCELINCGVCHRMSDEGALNELLKAVKAMS